MEWCIWQVQGLLHQYSLFGGSIVNIGDTNAGKSGSSVFRLIQVTVQITVETGSSMYQCRKFNRPQRPRKKGFMNRLLFSLPRDY